MDKLKYFKCNKQLSDLQKQYSQLKKQFNKLLIYSGNQNILTKNFYSNVQKSNKNNKKLSKSAQMRVSSLLQQGVSKNNITNRGNLKSTYKTRSKNKV